MKIKPASKQKRGSLYLKREKTAYRFIALPMILFAVFTFLPLVVGILLAFTSYDVVNDPQWVGLENFKTMLQDPFFWTCLRNTFHYVILYVPLAIGMSLITALLLNRRKRGTTFFRTAFYLPVLSSSVATATIWLWVLNANYGLLNQFLAVFSIDGPAWLADSQYTMFAVVLMSVWGAFGINMMIFLAGLKSVPGHLYEAAEMDGAGSFKRFIHVTLPSIRPAMFFVTMMTIIGAFQMFDQAYVLTEGGPGNSTKTIVYYIYDLGFGALRMGYASAIAMTLFGIIGIFAFLNLRFQKQSAED